MRRPPAFAWRMEVAALECASVFVLALPARNGIMKHLGVR